MTELFDWFRENDTLLWWLAATSAAMFLLTLLALPVAVARMPADYFTEQYIERRRERSEHPVLRVLGIIFKNIVGVIFLAAGLVMLLTPGQGILTMFVGVMLLSFPGKRRALRWVAQRQAVGKSLNWIRRRRRCEPFVDLPTPRGDRSAAP